MRLCHDPILDDEDEYDIQQDRWARMTGFRWSPGIDPWDEPEYNEDHEQEESEDDDE